MPRQRRIPGPAPVEEVRDVRDWAPPGWHWVVSPSGERSLLRIPGPAADPDHIWWQPMGPGSHPDQVWWQREQAPRVGGTSPYHGGGRARPSLLVGLGRDLHEHLVVHSEGSEP